MVSDDRGQTTEGRRQRSDVQLNRHPNLACSHSLRSVLCPLSSVLCHPSSTQVSLVPPPWLELTTSEPCLRATRVSPPGTMRMRSRPVSTNGRRSTCRGATPSSTQVGVVESDSVGCAMKFLGFVLSLARNAAIVALSDLGPISIP